MGWILFVWTDKWMSKMEIISAHHSKFCGQERPQTRSGGSLHQVTLNVIFPIAGGWHVEGRLGITGTFVAAPSREQLLKVTKAQITFSISDAVICSRINLSPDRKVALALCKVSIATIVAAFCVIQQFSQSGLFYRLGRRQTRAK